MKRGVALLLMIVLGGVSIVGAKSNFYEDNIWDGVSGSDKVAILMVHFGTSHNDTRIKTIDALNDLIAEEYPNVEQREAWTSRQVINILAKRGERMDNPAEALEGLKRDGYTHVIIQSSNVIEGVEMESLRRDVLAARCGFKDIRVGNPLLYDRLDYEVVVDALGAKQPDDVALVLVGHGTYTPATAQYAMVDYIIRERGYEAMHIGTIEGYPDFESVCRHLVKSDMKDVLLMPFMFVAGVHAQEDIEGDWRDELREQGYRVRTLLEGLGEMQEVQNLFLEHLEFAINNKMHDIVEKKSAYAEKR